MYRVGESQWIHTQLPHFLIWRLSLFNDLNSYTCNYLLLILMIRYHSQFLTLQFLEYLVNDGDYSLLFHNGHARMH